MKRRRVVGVCAVCHVDASPDHWHTASHLDRVAETERREAREREAALRDASPTWAPIEKGDR